MWLKIMFLAVSAMSAVSAEDSLSQLYGVSGGNRMQLCLRAVPGRRARLCAAALLHEEWLVLRASCLRQHPQHAMLAVRPHAGRTCDQVTHGYDYGARAVTGHFYHPYLDIALVIVQRPYLNLDVYPNSTIYTLRKVFKKHGVLRWMKGYIRSYEVHRDVHLHLKMVARGMVSTRAPLVTFLLTMVLPSVLFMLVFIYVIYYSGPQTHEIPYKNLQCTGKATQV
ncbi:uncharacterized protein LOC142974545 [Anticarsia gemmatalis]|uniref:uncharacterized protein LOC142974545 n=1 Tax=Anticarsia gemmatalis TaxID=129554 RepID=UPI003F76575D